MFNVCLLLKLHRRTHNRCRDAVTYTIGTYNSTVL